MPNEKLQMEYIGDSVYVSTNSVSKGPEQWKV